MNARHDVVVVGAGLAGLATAAALQAAGRKVLVLERAHAPGGMARSPAVAGQPVNLGPHALYLGGPAQAMLEDLGVPLEGFVPKPEDGFFQLGDALEPMPTSLWGLAKASWLTVGERFELARGLRRATAGDSAAQGKSLADWLARFSSPRVRSVLETLARVSTYTNAPGQLSAALALEQMAFAFAPGGGVRYLRGGWQTLVDALRPRLDIRTAAVERVISHGEVHLAQGEVLTAAAVVVALPLHAAAQVVDAPAVRERAQGAVPVRAACLDVVLEALPRPERRLALGLNEPTYFSVHSPRGHAAPAFFHAALYLPPGPPGDPAEARARLESFVDRVQPGWREGVREARYLPCLTVMDDVAREQPVSLPSPLYLVSTVASRRFLLDAALDAGARAVTALGRGASARSA